MRILKFIVEGQIIKPDPNCDFSNLVPGTEDYLGVEFIFSQEWRGRLKVASFWSRLGHEYPPQKIEDGYFCLVPSEATAKRHFKIQIIGRGKDGSMIKTNKLTITQEGGA